VRDGDERHGDEERDTERDCDEQGGDERQDDGGETYDRMDIDHGNNDEYMDNSSTSHDGSIDGSLNEEEDEDEEEEEEEGEEENSASFLHEDEFIDDADADGAGGGDSE
jgi:hypothetical protein